MLKTDKAKTAAWIARSRKPLARTKGLSQTGVLNTDIEKVKAWQHRSRKPLPNKSAKRTIEEREYSKIRKAFLLANPECFGCGKPASEIHHARGRSGSFYLDTRFFRPMCPGCHKTAHSDYQTALNDDVSMSRHRRFDER